MNFRTAVTPPAAPVKFGPDARFLLLGSCFADNVGARLSRDGFITTINPYGTLYNPLSIEAALRGALSPRELPLRMVQQQGVCHSYDHHTRLSGATPEALRANVESARSLLRTALQQATAVIITLGSAFIYTLDADGLTVANCHKQPAALFTRRRISPEEAAASLAATEHAIHTANPAATIIYTVSPVRHLADGAHGNALSKATLLLAVQGRCEQPPAAPGAPAPLYFPAFEILMDDLRDYRFYAPDMKHPSEVAVDYIYTLFRQTFLTPAAITEADTRRRAALRQAHRPIFTPEP